ncbi:hypothetical protein [Verrucomicrobium spinosum]|uniref:hypothetical protein n=1 Tax=Verrucomicrobium spinosum TaxID=2736 RepID=UPI000B3234C4|nr:hypothetical protein [Verrucomicrobium spinosum]
MGSGSGSSVRIPGVATTLQNLMNPKGSNPVNGPVYSERLRSRDGLRGEGLSSIGQPPAGSGAPRGAPGPSNAPQPGDPIEPIIVVDGRLNAIVVRDLAPACPSMMS